MDPLDAIKWIFVIILAMVGVALLLIFILLGVVIGHFFRERSLDIKKRERGSKLTVPAFESSKLLGQIFMVDYQAWIIREFETDYDTVRGKHRLRIIAESTEIHD